MRELTPEPLTAEAFAPFGSVIEASDAAVRIDINQGHAVRYDRLAEVDVADGGGNRRRSACSARSPSASWCFACSSAIRWAARASCR